MSDAKGRAEEEAAPARYGIAAVRRTELKRTEFKRKAGPSRRNGLPNSSTLARQDNLKPMSDKKRAENTKRRVVLRRIAEDRGYICEAGIDGVCGGAIDDGHEKLRRSQGGDVLDPKNIMLVCRACHDHIHSNVAEAIAAGFLTPSWAGVADGEEKEED